MSITNMTFAEWSAKGVELFGANQKDWQFVCPSCGHTASARDWEAAGAPETAVAFSCVGRWLPESKGEIFGHNGQPCNYAGGGLFRLNPIKVTDPQGAEHNVFAFAEASLRPASGEAMEYGSAAE